MEQTYRAQLQRVNERIERLEFKMYIATLRIKMSITSFIACKHLINFNNIIYKTYSTLYFH